MNAVVVSLSVSIQVARIDASRDFYEGYIGLNPIFAYGDKDFLETFPEAIVTMPGAYRGVVYEIGGAVFEIADGHVDIPSRGPAETTTSLKASLNLRVTSLGPLLRKSRPLTRVRVRHYYWGTLEMVIHDPDGFVVRLISPFSEREISEVRRLVEVEVVAPTDRIPYEVGHVSQIQYRQVGCPTRIDHDLPTNHEVLRPRNSMELCAGQPSRQQSPADAAELPEPTEPA